MSQGLSILRTVMTMNKTSYQQAEGKWAPLGYPKNPHLIRNCGCGEVAITNILIEMLQYINYNPATIQPYMKQYAEARGNGTYHYGIPAAMKHYGLTEVKEHPNMTSLWKELEKGDRVAVYLMGSRNAGSKKVHWTGSGHFVASVDYKKQNGKHYVYMKDSASKSSLRTGWITYEENIRGACLRVWTGKISGKAADIPEPPINIIDKSLTVDGIGGSATVKATQTFFKTAVDGYLTGQNKKQMQYYPSLTAVKFGKDGSPTVKALQKWLGVERDGILGKGTAAAWQHKLKQEGYYTGIVDGIFGAMSMKAWQKYLNAKLYGRKDPEPTKPTTTTTGSSGSTSGGSSSSNYKVIDVSYVQKSINWNKVKAAGIKGAIIRCGFRGYETGKLQEDERFMEHIKGAHKAGLKVGVYFFTEGINAAEGKAEAAYTLNLIKKAGIPLDYPIAIDTEYINVAKGKPQPRANKLSVAKRTEVVKAFCEEIKKQGYEPMIYASLLWFSNNLNMAKLPYKIWCAQYYKKCQYKGEYVMWQYTSEGKVNGISGVVDMNHCYIKDNLPTPGNKDCGKGDAETKSTASNVAVLSINELAKQVLEDKWGSGTDRKKNLEKAGYDYDKVQAKVNELLADTVLTREEVIANMNAWAKKIAADNTYFYKNWKSNDAKTHECPICKKYPVGKYHGWNCIGFAIAVWHHGGGLPCNCSCHVISDQVGEQIAQAKTDAEALKIVKKRVGMKDVTVIRNNGKNVPKSKWQAGDIGLMFSGNTYKHMFYIMGNGKIADSSGRSNKNDQIAVRNDKNYSARVIIRWTGGKKKEQLPAPAAKKAYTGELPSTKLIKTNAEVIADAIKFLKWIAGDNDFHYGHGKEAHHNGCYFCKTQPKSKKNAGIKDYEHTYCCNPLIGAAWAHGGCVPKALKLCRKGSSWDFSKGKGYDKSSLFANLGKPKKTNLKAGDVLCSDTHVATYIGGGKLIEASGGDDNVKGSKKWNNSIHIATLTDKRYAGFKRVHRFTGSVNTTCCIYHGEVSKRVELLQSFLKWYGYDISVDGIFGDATLKAVKDFQKKAGITADGIVGPNTITAMRKAVK